MINYINLFNQINSLNEIKDTIDTLYLDSIIMFTAFILIAISILTIFMINKIKHRKKSAFLFAIFILTLTTVLILIYINYKNQSNTLDDKTMIDIYIEHNSHEWKTEEQKEKAAIAKNQLTTEELTNLLRVNGVSDIELFKENIIYLKDIYSQKSKIFKVLYNKEPEISENDYVNSILNQFYMGKIENEPADITGFEEDYPKISINLKK